MFTQIQLLLFCGLWLVTAPATLLAQRVIDVPGSTQSQHLLVDLPPAATCDPADEYFLVETDSARLCLNAQLIYRVREDGTVDTGSCQLLASIPPSADQELTRQFHLQKGSQDLPSNASVARRRGPCFTFAESPVSLKLLETSTDAKTDRPVWQYNFRPLIEQSLPADDPRRSRSCYVHPLWGLHDEILTDDFPQDHYHHHGLFWTWPYVEVGDQTYDLWMSSGIEQRFVKWLAMQSGPVAGVMGVENGWFVGEQQVATERVWLRTYRSQAECRAIDITLVIEAGEQGITLQGREDKSYGGFTFRFDVSPRTDATVRAGGRTLGFGSPETAADPDLVNTPLSWADLTSHFPGAPTRSGAAVFIHPTHPDYPPTWLTRTYGALCVGWPGIKTYSIAPGKSIKLDYRVWIHADEVELDQIDAHYRAYRTSLDTHCQ